MSTISVNTTEPTFDHDDTHNDTHSGCRFGRWDPRNDSQSRRWDLVTGADRIEEWNSRTMARHGTMLPPPLLPTRQGPDERPGSHGPDEPPGPDERPGSDGHESALCTTTMSSPIGDLILVANGKGLRAVLWPGEEDLTAGTVDINDPDADVDPDAGVDPDAARILTNTIAQLTEYFDGRRAKFDLPLDPVGTEFQKSVWMVLREIPYGRTITYGEQARALGDVNKTRAVGSANGRNPISIIVPCHRVIGADESLTGYGGGIGIKEWLLRHERGSDAPQLPFG